MQKKLNTKILRTFKRSSKKPKYLNMLTCYDFQTAQLLNDSEVDLLLVGDSLGNVILGHDTTIQVSLEEMCIFSKAVKRGAPNKFVVADLPFGTYSSFEEGLKNAKELFQKSAVEALKLEGAFNWELDLIKRLTQIGIPVMGHIGLTPQSVHELGGYYTHGKDADSANELFHQAKKLEEAGCFSIVLECVQTDLAKRVTSSLKIPTIGIGAGDYVDGQVLVINDLFKLGKGPVPKFCSPQIDLYKIKEQAINDYQDRLHLQALKSHSTDETVVSLENH